MGNDDAFSCSEDVQVSSRPFAARQKQSKLIENGLSTTQTTINTTRTRWNKTTSTRPDRFRSSSRGPHKKSVKECVAFCLAVDTTVGAALERRGTRRNNYARHDTAHCTVRDACKHAKTNIGQTRPCRTAARYIKQLSRFLMPAHTAAHTFVRAIAVWTRARPSTVWVITYKSRCNAKRAHAARNIRWNFAIPRTGVRCILLCSWSPFALKRHHCLWPVRYSNRFR